MCARLITLALAIACLASTARAADIRSDTTMVLIPVSVRDRQDQLVRGLTARDFRVLDNNVEQHIFSVSIEDLPVSVCIVFDASGSMRPLLPKARQAFTDFLRTLDPEDETCLVQVGGRADLVSDLGGDFNEQRQRALFIGAGGRTPLLDGVQIAIRTLRRAHNSRKALLIISDGLDNYSRNTKTQVKAAILEANVQIYSICIDGPVNDWVAVLNATGGDTLLKDLTAQTGGRFFDMDSDKDMAKPAGIIGDELRRQYVVAYLPGEFENDNKFHRVEVRIAGEQGRRLNVHWRRGYYASAP